LNHDGCNTRRHDESMRKCKKMREKGIKNHEVEDEDQRKMQREKRLQKAVRIVTTFQMKETDIIL
jgi:hypothetical protein